MKERIKYSKDIPPEMLVAIKPYVARFAWMIPAWMQYVNISYANDTEDNPAIDTLVNHEYRWAEITFYPCWLNADAETRECNVIHELVHLSTNPIHDHARNTIKVLLGEGEQAERFFAIEEERLREMHEGMVQDLAHLIQERLPREATRKR